MARWLTKREFAARRRRVVELKRTGLTHMQVGERLGIHRSTSERDWLIATRRGYREKGGRK